MALVMSLNDVSGEVQLVIRVSGNYSPDVLDDMKSRLVDTLTKVYELKASYMEIEDEEPQSGMDAPL